MRSLGAQQDQLVPMLPPSINRTDAWPPNLAERAWQPAGLGKLERTERPDFSSTVAQREIRVVDKLTGGEKGSKLARFSLIPGEFVWALAEHFGIGARKYADRNWEKGYKWTLTLDALERHLNKIKMGEWLDLHEPTCLPGCTEHTNSPHIIAVAWHACALFIFHRRGLGTNDIHQGLGQ